MRRVYKRSISAAPFLILDNPCPNDINNIILYENINIINNKKSKVDGGCGGYLKMRSRMKQANKNNVFLLYLTFRIGLISIVLCE